MCIEIFGEQTKKHIHFLQKFRSERRGFEVQVYKSFFPCQIILQHRVCMYHVMQSIMEVSLSPPTEFNMQLIVLASVDSVLISFAMLDYSLVR